MIANKITGEQRARAREVRSALNGNRKFTAKPLEGLCYGKLNKDDPDDDDETSDAPKGTLFFYFDPDPDAGLAKNIKKTLLKQTGKTYKITVLGPTVKMDDETDVDTDEGPETEETEGEGDGVPKDSTVTTGEPDGTKTEEPKERKPASAAMLDLTQRAKAVRERLEPLRAKAPDVAAPFLTRLAAALALGKDRRVQEGIAALDELEADVIRALAVADRGEQSVADSEQDTARFEARLKELISEAAKAGLAPADLQTVKLKVSETRAALRQR